MCIFRLGYSSYNLNKSTKVNQEYLPKEAKAEENIPNADPLQSSEICVQVYVSQETERVEININKYL